jgi:hypothetical protein
MHSHIEEENKEEEDRECVEEIHNTLDNSPKEVENK